MTKQRFMQTAVNPTSAWLQQEGTMLNESFSNNAHSAERAGAVTKAEDKKAAICIEDYAAKANTTLL